MRKTSSIAVWLWRVTLRRRAAACAALLVACGGGSSAPAPQAPQEASASGHDRARVAPAPPAAGCPAATPHLATAFAATVELTDDNLREGLETELRIVTEQACRAQHWAASVTACYAAAGTPDAVRYCTDDLTPVQQTNLSTSLSVVMARYLAVDRRTAAPTD